MPKITRRRPPGWTPLRAIELPTHTPTHTPTNTPPKESSEEVQDMSSTGSTATNLEMAAPTTTPTPQASSTFNCPSKPWKQFIPQPVVPLSTNTSKPESDGLFSDADLLS